MVLLNGERLNVRVQVTWLEMFRSLTFDTFDIPFGVEVDHKLIFSNFRVPPLDKTCTASSLIISDLQKLRSLVL